MPTWRSLGAQQTEDLKVACSIQAVSIIFFWPTKILILAEFGPPALHVKKKEERNFFPFSLLHEKKNL